MWYYYVLIACFLLFSILIVRTIRFKKQHQNKDIEPIDLDKDKLIHNFIKKIKIPTVSYRNPDMIDQQAFSDFKSLLKDDYPHIKKHATSLEIGTGILFHIKGESNDKPIVLMAHFDVVPTSKNWSVEPFSGNIVDDYIYGRGTLDTKVTVHAIMESVEYVLSHNHRFKHDIYIAFSGEEEINGPTQQQMVSYFEKHDIKPHMVFDEGGAIVSNMFPGVKEHVAVIGVAEKGFVNIELSAKAKGGHASAPPKDTPVTMIAHAIDKLNQSHAFKMKLTKPIQTMFNYIAPYSTSFPIRLIFANQWLFNPLIKLIAKLSGGELYAMFKSTLAFTVLKGSTALNVLPSQSSVGINIRIRPEESSDDIVKKIKKIIANKDIEISVIDVSEPTPTSYVDDTFSLFDKAIKKTWHDTITSPYLMVATTDSRHYHRICDRVYKFAPYQLTKEDLRLIHGDDERIKIDNVINSTKFYIHFLRQL